MFPDIEVGGGGVYVVYNGTDAFPTPSTQVWFLESNNGKDWSTPVQISTPGVWAGAATMSVDLKAIFM